MAVEPFGLHDNLMLAGAIVGSGGSLMLADAPVGERYSWLAAFEACVVKAAAHLCGT